MPGRCPEVMSRTPAKGEVVGGPRGAEVICGAEEEGAFCGGDGGGIFRVGKDGAGGGGGGASRDPVRRFDQWCCCWEMLGEICVPAPYCGGLAAAPEDRRGGES